MKWLGEEGVERLEPTLGRLSKWSAAGEEMAESEEMREEMTSGDAGCTFTRLAE